MNVVAVNGSPRKTWNTATLLDHALAGAREQGAQTELVHLYDHAFTGCVSCFSCKKIGGASYGKCAVTDGITGLLERVAQADALILGSPLYFGVETGEMRSFLERLLFPYVTYTPGYKAIFPRAMPTAFVYTMNVTEQVLENLHQRASIEHTRGVMERVFGSCEVFLCTDTFQFSDYSKYLCTAWDAEAKAKRRKEVFPQDCARAFELGARLAGKPQA